jgi:hypothetical protein
MAVAESERLCVAGVPDVLDLPQVTLCCVDAKNHALALRALARCTRQIRFARTLFLTDRIPPDVKVPAEVEVIGSGPIASHEDYSQIVLKRLHPHIDTSHVLLVQWDGYVVHPDAWTDEFMTCDYIGAPWRIGLDGYAVGNGGFSLRSKKLLAALEGDAFPLVTNTEDVTICTHHRPRLESDFGIRFASVELARKFSFEMDAHEIISGAKTFGFHGIFNLFLVENEPGIAAVAAALSDSAASSEMVAILLQNLLNFGQFEAALAVSRRMLNANPEDEIAAQAVVQARELAASRAKSIGSGNLAARVLGKLRAH